MSKNYNYLYKAAGFLHHRKYTGFDGEKNTSSSKHTIQQLVKMLSRVYSFL